MSFGFIQWAGAGVKGGFKGGRAGVKGGFKGGGAGVKGGDVHGQLEVVSVIIITI